MPAKRGHTGLTSKLKIVLFSKSSKTTGQIRKFEERVSRRLGNGWFVQYSHVAQDFILWGLGKCQFYLLFT